MMKWVVGVTIFGLVACDASSGRRSDDHDGDSKVADLGAPADLASGERSWGFISAYSQSYQVDSTQMYSASSLQAGFRQRAGAPSCVDTPIGECVTHTSCKEDTSPVEWVSAGTVKLQGAAHVVTIAKGAGTYQPFWDMTASLYDGGEALTFSASGATAPAFSTKLTAPSLLHVTSPAVPSNGERMPMSRSKDFVVQWAKTGVGDVVVALGPVSGYVTITCRFARDEGSGVVPKAAMAKLSSGDGSLSVNTESAVVVHEGDWTIDVTANNSAIDAAGYAVSVPAIFQ